MAYKKADFLRENALQVITLALIMLSVGESISVKVCRSEQVKGRRVCN
uniref:Uncharacterized protein n=1 Tax=Rhodnius prolixus TaxID=13249 RepID=T1HQ81_RHOPR